MLSAVLLSNTLILMDVFCQPKRGKLDIFPGGQVWLTSSMTMTTRRSNASGDDCDGGDNCTTAGGVSRCGCDDQCEAYFDCCRHGVVQRPDVDAAGTATSSSSKRRRRVPDFVGCQLVGTNSTDKKYGEISMIIDCLNSSSSSHRFLVDECRRGQSADADGTFHRLPVVGGSTGLLYRNVYCARCHGEANITFWNAMKVCPQRLTMSPSMDRSRGGGGSGGGGGGRGGGIVSSMYKLSAASTCPTEFVPPKNVIRRPRRCTASVDRCAGDWLDETVSQKCRDARSALYVYVGSKVVYRNRHCALCNRVDATLIACKAPSPPPTIFSGRQMLPAFSVLLDLNAGSGTLSDNSKNQVGSGAGEVKVVTTVVELRRCADGEVYDPLSDGCRLLFCRAGFQLTDGGCTSDDRRQNSSENHRQSSNSSAPLDSVDLVPSCPLIRLNSSEYSLLDNGSALVLAFHVVYSPTEYHRTINGDGGDYIEVCNPSFEQSYNLSRNVTHYVVMFKFDLVQGVLSFLGVLVSLVALAVQFFVYMMFPVLRNTPGKCIVCLVASLFVGQVLYLLAMVPGPACPYMGAVMHYAWLAAFFWMNVLAVDLFKTFSSGEVSRTVSSGSMSKKFVVYSVYAWLAPAVIVAVAAVMDLADVDDVYRPHYGRDICWIASRKALVVFFAVPLGGVLLANVFLFAASVHHIRQASKASRPAVHTSDAVGHLVLYVKLSFVVGLPWVFGFLAALNDWTVLWYLFIVFNSLQGAFVCFTFVCTRNVFRLLADLGGRSQPTSAQQSALSLPANSFASVARQKRTNITRSTTVDTDG